MKPSGFPDICHKEGVNLPKIDKMCVSHQPFIACLIVLPFLRL
jgi:hypothetical protein